jgi:hypothetical protein
MYTSKYLSFIAGVVDTAYKHLYAIIRKFETIPMGYSGARGTMIYEKIPEVENLVSGSL